MISATPASLGTDSLLPFDPRASQAPVQGASHVVKESVSPAAPVRPLSDVLSITGENLPQKPEEILTTLAQLTERAGAGSSEAIQTLQKFLKSTTLNAESAEGFAPRLKTLVEGEPAIPKEAGQGSASPKNWMNEVARLAQDIDHAAQTHAPANHVQDLIARAAHSLVEGMTEPRAQASNEGVIAKQTAFARPVVAQATYALPDSPNLDAGSEVIPGVLGPAANASEVTGTRTQPAADPSAAAAPSTEHQAAQASGTKSTNESSAATQTRTSNEAVRNGSSANSVQAAPASASQAQATKRPESSNGNKPVLTTSTRPDVKTQPSTEGVRNDPGTVKSNQAPLTQLRGQEGEAHSAAHEPSAARDAGRTLPQEGRTAEARPSSQSPTRMVEGSNAFGRPAPMEGAPATASGALGNGSMEGTAKLTSQAGGVATAALADATAARGQPTASWTGVLPLEIGGKLAPARLSLEWTKPPEEDRTGDSKAGKPQAARPVSVALDLASEEVGRLSVRMTWLNNELVGVFLADRPEMVALAEQRIGDLETRLNSAAPGKVTFRVGGLAEVSA